MYCLKVEDQFCSAHFLYEYEGKCQNLHEHNWRVVVEFAGCHLEKFGNNRDMLLDFKDARAILKEVVDKYDHKFIIEEDSLGKVTKAKLTIENFNIVEIEGRPTAENFSRIIYRDVLDKLAERGIKNVHVESVEIDETPNNCCIYYPEK